MSISANPYESPQADISPVSPLASQGGLSEAVLIYLREASPWLRFIGILSFIGAGFMVLIGVLILLLPDFRIWNPLGGFRFIGLVYMGLSLLVFFPGRFIYNFGVRLRDYLRSGAEQDLELAFKNNKSLWKFYGILAIVYLAVVPVTVVLGIIAALTSSLY